MDEVRLTGAMAGLDPDAAARAREPIAELVEEDQVIARAEGRKAPILAELDQIGATGALAGEASRGSTNVASYGGAFGDLRALRLSVVPRSVGSWTRSRL